LIAANTVAIPAQVTSLQITISQSALPGVEVMAAGQEFCTYVLVVQKGLDF